MTASTSTRYDFGRCTVEHVGGTQGGSPDYPGGPVTFGSMSITIRVAQANYDKHDEAIATLVDFEARALADEILRLLGEAQ